MTIRQIVDHNGGIPGFSSQVMLLPSEKLGIVVLANGDAKHTPMLAVIYRIIEDYFKLPRKESERLLTLSSAHKQFIKPASSISKPDYVPLWTLPLTNLAGTYSSPGYGALTLCIPTPTPTPECSSILGALSPFYDVYNASIPELYTPSRSCYASHLRFVHKYANVFDVHGTFLFANGYGKDKTPFEVVNIMESAATAEFWVEDGRVRGFALNGYIGETTEQQRCGGTVEDRAEIWFEKF